MGAQLLESLALARSRQGSSISACGYQKTAESVERILSSFLMHAHRSVRLVDVLIHIHSYHLGFPRWELPNARRFSRLSREVGG
jgi:hypothetical protein